MDFTEIDRIIPLIVEKQSENIHSKNAISFPAILEIKRAVAAQAAYLKSRILNSQKPRELNFVSQVYSSIYGASNDAWIKRRANNRYVLEYRRQKLIVNGWFLLGLYVGLIDKILKQTKAESAIEIGSGRGNNISVLALKNPQVNFTGLEYSQNGFSASNALIENLPRELLEMAGAPCSCRPEKVIRNAKFYNADACNAPFKDSSFDLSYTVLVLEQMPHKFQNAISEMRRITKKYCVFIEPFLEANKISGILYLKTVDYFRFSYKNFIKFGLKPVYFTDNFPQKYKYHAGLLITEVMH